jgi:hypothetical protein
MLCCFVYECCHNPSLGLTTKAKACKGAGQEGSSGITSHVLENAKECEGMNLHTPKELPGSWSPSGLSNLQKVIARVKTQWIEKFFISLKK